MPSAGEITGLLVALRRGDRRAESDLAELIYNDLHAQATKFMRRERPDHTLQPTALVHETYLRLMQGQPVEWKNRAHFFATASLVMRRILVDHARSRASEKRPIGRPKVELNEFLASENPRIEQLLILDEALDRLSKMDGRQGRLVEMMYFGGLTEEEAAHVLGVSARTVRRDWSSARAWLQAQFSKATV